MASKSHYRTIVESRSEYFETAFRDQGFTQRHTAAHNRLAELEALLAPISERPESCLASLGAELLAEALLQVAMFNYRLAHFSLRGFLEGTLFSIRFSVAEFEYRQWCCGNRDGSWAEILDEDKGVFSKPFLRAFCPELAEYGIQYRALAARVYRECSEYVHGNIHTHGLLPELDSERASRFFDALEAAYISVAFAYLGRFRRELSSSTFSTARDTLAPDFGHLVVLQ